jgi:hypothetical protein
MSEEYSTETDSFLYVTLSMPTGVIITVRESTPSLHHREHPGTHLMV